MNRIMAALGALLVATVMVTSAATYLLLAEVRQIQADLEYRHELRSFQLCDAGNETRQVVAMVLDALTEPRPEDAPGEHAERLRLRERVDPYVQPKDCPPRPERP